MEPLAIITVLLLAALIVLVLLLLNSFREAATLKRKFSPIIDVDSERRRIQDEIARITSERDKSRAEFQAKKEQLTSEYTSAHQMYEKLQKELALLEESLELTEFGVYKPHFDFGSSEEYRNKLDQLWEKEKEMIRSDQAVFCETEWSVSGSKAEGRKMTRQTHKLMLRAFNGECDAAIAKVRWDNATKMEERISKGFETINKSGEVNRSI